ncbi:MAG: TolC family protein [Gemmatimonadales bacterium]|jgi:cobalt-zinc-cadmium efflux system outer membrane protein
MLLITVLLLQAAVPTGDSLTLAGALARARKLRPVVSGAAAAVAEAHGAARVAMTVPNPVVSYSWTGNTPRQHITVDQPLDWLLRRGADHAAGQAGIARAGIDSILTLAELGREVRLAFYDALAGDEALRLTADEASLADSLARAADARLKAGDISQLERDQVIQESQRAHYAVSLAREDQRVAHGAFARALGLDDAPLPEPDGALDDGLTAPLPGVVRSDSLPLVQGALADSAFAAALARSASIGQLPLPSLQGGAEWNDPANPSQGTTAILGFAIPVPLWNHGGGLAAESRAQAARVNAALGETRLDAARALGERRIRLEETARRARFDRDSLFPAARRLRERTVTAYRAGETGVLPVFDALRGEHDAALALVRDLTAFQDALAEWNALVGLME